MTGASPCFTPTFASTARSQTLLRRRQSLKAPSGGNSDPASPASESHLVSRIGWLRAAVLGANDGIVSTASLIVGVAAASAAASDVLVAGVAGLVAGAMSMAAGEYVSVSSQSDTEQADLRASGLNWRAQPDFEREELAQIYVEARSGAKAGAQGRRSIDGEGCTWRPRARRTWYLGSDNGASHTGGADLRGNIRRWRGDAAFDGHGLAASRLVPDVSLASLLFLAVLGAMGARAGGANVVKATFASHSGVRWRWR